MVRSRTLGLPVLDPLGARHIWVRAAPKREYAQEKLEPCSVTKRGDWRAIVDFSCIRWLAVRHAHESSRGRKSDRQKSGSGPLPEGRGHSFLFCQSCWQRSSSRALPERWSIHGGLVVGAKSPIKNLDTYRQQSAATGDTGLPRSSSCQ